MAETGKTNEYEFTDRAGKRVGGHIVDRTKTLWLSDAEAEHGLSEGTIVPKGKELHKAFTETTKPVATMQAEARAFRGLPPAAEPEVEAAAKTPPAKRTADPAPPAPAADTTA